MLEPLPFGLLLYFQSCVCDSSVEDTCCTWANRFRKTVAPEMTGDLVSLGCHQIAVRAKDRGLPVLLGLGQVSVKIISGESQVPQGGLFHTSPSPMCVAARGSSTTVVCPGVAGEGPEDRQGCRGACFSLKPVFSLRKHGSHKQGFFSSNTAYFKVRADVTMLCVCICVCMCVSLWLTEASAVGTDQPGRRGHQPDLRELQVTCAESLGHITLCSGKGDGPRVSGSGQLRQIFRVIKVSVFG